MVVEGFNEGKERKKEVLKGSSPIHSYKDACTKDDVVLVDTDEEDEEWWRDDGLKEGITIDKSGKVPNIVISDELKKRMAKR